MKESTSSFSLIRTLVIALLGNLYLRFEGRMHIREQRFMIAANIAVTEDSLAEKENQLADLQAQLDDVIVSHAAKTKLPDQITEAKSELEDLQVALANHQTMFDNLSYKAEILKRI